jgi:hypothetical protein
MLPAVIHDAGMAKQTNKTIRDEQIMIRLSSPLRRELELAAEQDARPVSALARRILVDWAQQRFAERETQAA